MLRAADRWTGGTLFPTVWARLEACRMLGELVWMRVSMALPPTALQKTQYGIPRGSKYFWSQTPSSRMQREEISVQQRFLSLCRQIGMCSQCVPSPRLRKICTIWLPCRYRCDGIHRHVLDSAIRNSGKPRLRGVPGKCAVFPECYWAKDGRLRLAATARLACRGVLRGSFRPVEEVCVW